MRLLLLFGGIFSFLVSCSSSITPSISEVLDSRFSIIGHFRSPNQIDTLEESYFSTITNKEIRKEPLIDDYDSSVAITFKQKPTCILSFTNGSTPPFVVSKTPQNRGVYLFRNLGDLDEDGLDEFGYAVNFADYSSLNQYYIMSIKNNKIVQLYSIGFREFQSGNESIHKLDINSIFKKIGPRTIEFEVENPDGEIEKVQHTFKSFIFG